MDAEYLKETVGIALAQGIAETSISKPDDPIEFLGLWLIKYVENKKREAKLREDAIKLKEQEKAYLENLEHQRIRREEEKRRAEEEAKRRAEENESKRLARIKYFEDAKDQRNQEISSLLLSTQEEDIKRRKLDSLLPWRLRLSLHVQFIEELSSDEITELNTATPTLEEIVIIKALFTLLGVAFKFPKWTQLKQLLKKIELKKLVKEFSPTKPQTTKKFMVTAGYLNKLNRNGITDRIRFSLLVILEWIDRTLELRNEGIRIKFLRLGHERKEEPIIDPDTVEDEDDDLDQDNLSDYAPEPEEEVPEQIVDENELEEQEELETGTEVETTEDDDESQEDQ